MKIICTQAWRRENCFCPPQFVFSAQTRGLDIPGDIGYASLDVDGDVSCYAGVSGIDKNSHLVGAAAVDLLVEVGALQRGQRGVPETPVRMAVGGVWRVGESAVKQSAAKS